MTADQLAKAWLRSHPRLSQATLHEAASAGFELIEVNGKPVLVHGTDIDTIEDAVAGVATATTPTQESHPTEELAQLRAELAEARQQATNARHEAIQARAMLAEAWAAAEHAATGTHGTRGTAGARAYAARTAGQRWTDQPPGAREYARSHARRRGLPWPPAPKA